MLDYGISDDLKKESKSTSSSGVGISEKSLVTDKISIETLSRMTGFSEEVIKKELFTDSFEKSETEVSLQSLRSAMLKLIDTTFAKGES